MDVTKIKFFIMSALLLTSISLNALTIERNGVKYDLDSSTRTASATAADESLTDAVIEGTVTNDEVVYTVTSIADRGFFNCRNLRTVTVPASVRKIGTFAFLGCSALERVDGTTLDDWLAIAFADGFSNPLVYGHNLYLGGTLLENLRLPEGLEKVPDYAFIGTSIKSLVLPASVTEIGRLAFFQCESLTTFEAGQSLSTIATQAFDGCTGLKSAVLAPAVTTVASHAFNDCKAMTSVTFGDAVTTVGENVFAGCDALEAVDIADVASWCRIEFANDAANPLTKAHILRLNGKVITALEIPEGITAIKDGAFAGCTAIESVVAGKDVTTIGAKAFNACPALQSIRFDGPVNSIGEYAFEGCGRLAECELPSTLMTVGRYAFYGTSLTAVRLADSVTELPDGVFGECDGLKTVTFPDGLTSIGFGCFYYCTSLTEITLPETVTKIGKSAFYGCRGLRTVRLGKDLASLATFVFGGCTALTDVYVGAPEPPVAPENAFSAYTATLHVPQASVSAYTADATWGRFTDIRPIDDSVTDPVRDGAISVIGRTVCFEGLPSESVVEIYTLGAQQVYIGAPATLTLAPGTYVVRALGTARTVLLR